MDFALWTWLCGAACLPALAAAPGGLQDLSPELRWRSPALPAQFQYGGKSSAELLPRWRVSQDTRSKTNHSVRILELADPQTKLHLRAEIRELKVFNALEWVLFFENRGAEDTPILENVQAASLTLPKPKSANYTLHYADGSNEKATDFQPREAILAPGQILKLAPVGGRSSDGTLPYFNLASPDGGGLFVAIGWSGQWSSEFTREPDGQLRFRAGLERCRLRLHPGERIRTPAILAMRYAGQPLAGHNQFRRLMLEQFTPHPGGRELQAPVAASGALAGFNNVSEANQIQAVTNLLLHKLPVDYYWIDAGWSRGGFPLGMGNWDPDPARFPHGLQPVAETVNQAGLKFLVWFEPERVMTNTWLRMQHPEWLLAPSNMPPPLAYQQREEWRLLDLGNPAALAWAKRTFSGRIRDLGLSVYRHDFNMHPLYYWRTGEPEDRQGIHEIQYITGFYDYLDTLQRENPDVLLDNSASGGRRLDFEMMRRSVPLLRTDYLWDPVGAQSMTWAISLWLPLTGQGAVSLDPYDFRSGMGAFATYAFDFYNPKADFWQPLARRIDEFRKVQKFFRGNFRPLTDYSTAQNRWIAWQFDRPDLGEGLVQAFRRREATEEKLYPKLGGLAPNARYEITDLDGGNQICLGSDLLDGKVPILLREKPSAALLVYRKLR